MFSFPFFRKRDAKTLTSNLGQTPTPNKQTNISSDSTTMNGNNSNEAECINAEQSLYAAIESFQKKPNNEVCDELNSIIDITYDLVFYLATLIRSYNIPKKFFTNINTISIGEMAALNHFEQEQLLFTEIINLIRTNNKMISSPEKCILLFVEFLKHALRLQEKASPELDTHYKFIIDIYRKHLEKYNSIGHIMKQTSMLADYFRNASHEMSNDKELAADLEQTKKLSAYLESKNKLFFNLMSSSYQYDSKKIFTADEVEFRELKLEHQQLVMALLGRTYASFIVENGPFDRIRDSRDSNISGPFNP